MPPEQMLVPKLALAAVLVILIVAIGVLSVAVEELVRVGFPQQYDAGFAAGRETGFAAGELKYPVSEPLLVTMVVNLSDAPTGSLLTLNGSVSVGNVTFSFSYKVEKCDGGKEEVTVEFKPDVKVDVFVSLSIMANGTPSPWTLGPDERSITLDIAYDIATGLWMVTERTSPFP